MRYCFSTTPLHSTECIQGGYFAALASKCLSSALQVSDPRGGAFRALLTTLVQRYYFLQVNRRDGPSTTSSASWLPSFISQIQSAELTALRQLGVQLATDRLVLGLGFDWDDESGEEGSDRGRVGLILEGSGNGNVDVDGGSDKAKERSSQGRGRGHGKGRDAFIDVFLGILEKRTDTDHMVRSLVVVAVGLLKRTQWASLHRWFGQDNDKSKDKNKDKVKVRGEREEEAVARAVECVLASTTDSVGSVRAAAMRSLGDMIHAGVGKFVRCLLACLLPCLCLIDTLSTFALMHASSPDLFHKIYKCRCFLRRLSL